MSHSQVTAEAPIGVRTTERIHQIVYSKFYIILYVVMIILSVSSFVLSVISECPGLAYEILEIIVNVAMISEVVILMIAYGRKFWRSPMNVFDLVLLSLCIAALVLVFLDCSYTKERGEVAGTIFMALRNVLQISRLLNNLRKQRVYLKQRQDKIVIEEKSSMKSEEGNLDTVHTQSHGYILEEGSEVEYTVPSKVPHGIQLGN
ncbi:hypothetical protein K7432_000700 [Basidiobolus ranarum]|uniref:Ion transport domain-containing protein n=1 Tax=Basidiobolus ranarum TaxID=34480 RepID=A0ABR2X457_9FUNG